MRDEDFDDPKFNEISYRGNSKLKRMGEQIELTEAQLKEYIRCSKDPIYFIKNYVKIISIDHGIVPFELWSFQERMVEHIVNNRFSIIKLSRQVGKTTTTVAMMLWYTLFNDNYAIALLANKMQQSAEILARYQLAYENLPKWLQQGIDTWNKRSIRLENGANILASATSSSAVRGQTYNMIYLDEFAHVPMHLQNEFYTSTYPVITSGNSSKVVITSTPKGLNLFYKLWKDAEEGNNEYEAFSAHWSEVPGHDAEWKATTVRNIGEQRWKQEFETEFIGSSSTLISGNKLLQLAASNPIQQSHDTVVFEAPIQGHIYTLTADTARGVGNDSSSFVIIDVTEVPYRIAMRYDNNTISPLIFPSIIHTWATRYNEAYVLVEVNDNGQQVADILAYELEYENMFMSALKGQKGRQISDGYGKATPGMRTTAQSKLSGCMNLKTLVEEDKLIISDMLAIEQLYVFVENNKGSYAAEEGNHDDVVMTLVLFAWLTHQSFFKEWSDINVRERLMSEKRRMMEEDMLPFGFISGYEEGYSADTYRKDYEIRDVSSREFDSFLEG